MRFLKTCITALLAAASITAFADSITGTVTNGTNKKPSAGDDVVLIRLAQGMQEATRTKTDANGHFTLEVPDPGLHLVRVTHEKANYFRPAPPGTQSVDMEVFDAAAKVKGVSLEAETFRVQTDEPGNNLRVVQNFFIKNESTPPKTQFSDRPFELTLPDGAVIESSAALAPGGMPVQSQPVPLQEKGHYTYIFPIRPGETRFQLSYHVPYSGSFTFSNSLTLPTGTLVVILPKSMQFQGGKHDFRSLDEGIAAQTMVARQLPGGSPLGFSVSGAGQLPRPTEGNGQAQAEGGDASSGGPETGAAASTQNRPGGGIGEPIGTPDPLTKYKWWILGGLALLMAIGAGFLLRTPPQQASKLPLSGTQNLEAVLRDELFALEADRVAGRISEEEYAALRPAFDLVFKRAMERNANQQKPPSV